MFVADRSKFQEFKQKVEILIIYHKLTFTKEIENSGNLNVFIILHYLTKIKLLEDSCYGNLCINNFIFCMPTFWIHKPFTMEVF